MAKDKVVKPGPFMTTTEAVAITGLSKRTICRLCVSGDVPAVKIRSRWLINREAFMNMLAEAMA